MEDKGSIIQYAFLVSHSLEMWPGWNMSNNIGLCPLSFRAMNYSEHKLERMMLKQLISPLGVSSYELQLIHFQQLC